MTRKVEQHFQAKLERISELKITHEVVNLCSTGQSSSILMTWVYSIHVCQATDFNKIKPKAEKYAVCKSAHLT